MSISTNATIRRRIPALIAICLLSAAAEGEYGGGTGTPADPYRIATKNDLLALAADTNDYAAHFVLTADIDLSAHTFTTALIAPDVDNEDYGFQGTPFTGVFDGGAHTITGLVVDGGARNNWLGLFGRIDEGGQVKNLGLGGSSITAHINGAGDYIGGLVGEIVDGSVSNCAFNGSVTGAQSVGGLVGRIVTGDVSDCYSTGSVNGRWGVGGLVGSNFAGAVSNCYSTGDVTSGWDVGGLVGENQGSVWTCHSTGDVAGDRNVGGLVGENRGSVLDCYATGDVSGRDDIGGLVGDNSSGTASNCYSTGDLDGSTDVGGLVGSISLDGVVSNCFWATDTQTHGVVIGVGDDRGTVTNLVGLPAAQMQIESTFTAAGWDFISESANGTSETWQMPDGGGYPVLSYLHIDVPVPLAGGGTDADPFLIGTAAELGMVRWYPKDCCFKLSSDIDLSGIHWSASLLPVFSGSFDGDDHTITSMQISGGGRLGMFGLLREGGRVMGLGLEGLQVNGTGRYVGGLVGANGDSYNLAGTITECRLTGDVSGDDTVGGLLGTNRGSVSGCNFAGNVDANDWCAGGLVGENGVSDDQPGTITSCCSAGAVSGRSEVGGLVGRSTNGTVSSCFSTAEVTASEWFVGGLIGYNRQCNVSNCYATGGVSGAYMVGGLVGDNSAGTIRNCYSTGSVSGTAPVGGLCARHSVSGAIINCFWDRDTSGGLYSAGGWAMTTARMMTESTYVGWNNGAWVIDEGRDYPHLVWEGTAGNVIDYEHPRTYPGNGQDQPFQLDSPVDLRCLSLRPADWDKNFILTGDIDMSSLPDYRPVGLFVGSLGGRGHVVRNLTINAGVLGNNYHLGLFGKIGEGSQITTLGVQDANVIGGDHCRYLGGLCGENAEGTITACFTTGSVTGGIDSDDLGGLCGDNDRGTIRQSYSLVSVSATHGSHDLGGICGKNEGVIIGCYAAGVISGTTVQELGGLCGENDHGTIIGSNATGSVTAEGYSANLGGLVGISMGGTIRDCYSTGAVEGGTDSWHLGGLVGGNSGGVISGCYSSSPVTVIGDAWHMGGLVGWNTQSTVSNCYATGSVGAGEGAWYLGGLVGFNSASTIRNCYSIGSVLGGAHVGGLCGRHSVSGAITNSFWDKEASGVLYSAGGLAMTTAEMMTESTYVGWNNGAWVIDEGRDYPRLLWEGTPGDVIDYEYPRTYPGDGRDQPFELDSPDDMLCMSLRPVDWDKNFIMTGDVDMSSVIYYQPPTPFTGSFDGQGHVLENLTIDANIIGSQYHLGVFGKIEVDGRVANLAVVDVNIVGADSCRYVGGLCGENAEGTITRCFTTGWVTGGTESDDLGGLCGDNERGTITQSCSSVSVSAGDDSHDLGGLCGKNEGTLMDCYATGAVSGGDVRELGGLCGENHWRGTIRNCYSTGTVSAGGAEVGGLCGDNEGGTVVNSFWDVQASGLDASEGGTGLTTSEMKTKSTYADSGWDFVGETANGNEDIWCICEGQDYPTFTWQFVSGDFNADLKIDSRDLAILSMRWSSPDSGFLFCRGADLTNDGLVDCRDLMVFAESWLRAQ